MPDFVHGTQGSDTDWEIGFERVPRAVMAAGSIESRMFECFGTASREPDRKWVEISLVTQRVEDDCEQSARSGRAVLLEGNEPPPYR